MPATKKKPAKKSAESPTAGLKIERVAIADLIPDPANANLHPERNLQAIQGSLAKFKQQKPLVVTKDNVVSAGNGTLEAAKRLGWTHLDVVRTNLSGAELIAYGIADNKTSELAEWDYENLSSLLRGLGDDKDLLEATGFDESEIATLLDGLSDGLSDEDLPEISDGLSSTDLFSEESILNSAFEYFRAMGFPYRNQSVHQCMIDINRLSSCEDETLDNTILGYHVADTYHPHRFDGHADGKTSPAEAFKQDKLLKRALLLQLNQAGTIPDGLFGALCMVSGTQACSNFRPGFACKIYKKYCGTGGRVLDCCTGYGGRLVGFFGANVSESVYVGIDPSTKTHAGNQRLAEDLGMTSRCELINKPAEDVTPDEVGTCDLALTSPPYFAKEVYSDESTQSRLRYPEAEKWRCDFLRPMLQLQFDALKDGALNVVNIADVKISGKTYELESWTIEDAREIGFKHEMTTEYPLTLRFGQGAGAEVSAEPVLWFRK